MVEVDFILISLGASLMAFPMVLDGMTLISGIEYGRKLRLAFLILGIIGLVIGIIGVLINYHIIKV